MINEKMYKLGSERSQIRELFEYGLARKAQIGEENVFDFSLGNPSVPCPDELNEALTELIKSESSVKLHGYTSAQGDVKTREAIAEHIRKTQDIAVTKDHIYVTVGAAAALCCALGAVVSPGEEVILLAPYFPEYTVFTESSGATVRAVKCKKDSFEPDVEAIERAINKNTAAIIINSPNNPTGAVYSEETVKQLAELMKRKSRELGHPIYLIADEPYRELVYGGVSVPIIPKFYDDTIVCYSYSKSLSIPGERIGYCMVNPTMQGADKVYSAIAGRGRALGYVCAPSLLQKALPHLLGMTSDLSIYEENRQLLLTELRKYGYEVTEPHGAFYMFVKSPTGDGNEFSRMAMRHEILVVPSDSFGYTGYVRVSYCVDKKTIENALFAFSSLAKEMGLKGEANEG